MDYWRGISRSFSMDSFKKYDKDLSKMYWGIFPWISAVFLFIISTLISADIFKRDFFRNSLRITPEIPPEFFQAIFPWNVFQRSPISFFWFFQWEDILGIFLLTGNYSRDNVRNFSMIFCTGIPLNFFYWSSKIKAGVVSRDSDNPQGFS